MSEEIKDTPEQLLEKLRAANAEAKSYREQLEATQSQLETANTWKDRALKAEVKSQLRGEGIKEPDRILKLLDLEGVTLEEDGKVAGLSEKVAAVKKDWPELFDVKKSVANGADIFANGEVKQKMSGTEAQVKRLFSNV